MVNDTLELKDYLLNPKRSQQYNLWFYLDGWRWCEVKVGSKRGSVTPVAGGHRKVYSIRALKEELKDTYWYAARCHAGRNKKKRSVNWQRHYA